MVRSGTYSIAIVAAGVIDHPELLAEEVARYSTIVAVDGGLHYCAAMGVTPTILIGDFDSTEPELLSRYLHLPIHRFPVDKDSSDLELALALPEARRAADITVFGATGGRTDHLISNLQLLTEESKRLTFESEIEWIFALPMDATLSLHIGQQISLMPLFGPVEGVFSEGLEWELTGSTLDQHRVSLSNRATANRVRVRHRSGTLLCIVTK